MAQGGFAGIQFSYSGGNHAFSRTAGVITRSSMPTLATFGNMATMATFGITTKSVNSARITGVRR